MAQDEGIFGRINKLMRSWAPPGIRPEVAHQIIRKYVNVFAAVCPEQGKVCSLILPYSNTEMMNLFLEHVSEEFKNYFIIMQLDKAAWHTSDKLKLPENIRLIHQPARSPELNPVEHLWEEIREKFFANCHFKTLDDVINLLCQAINSISDFPDKIRTLTYFTHLRITSSNAN